MEELNNKIEQILKDLYLIDSSFKQHEAKIKSIISEVLLAKPDTKFDERFAAELRHKLMAQADLLKEKNTLSLLHRAGFLKKLNYALGFVAIAGLVVAAGTVYRRPKDSGSSPQLLQVFSSAAHINKLESNAFGKLTASLPVGSSAGFGRGGAEPSLPSSNEAAAQGLNAPAASEAAPGTGNAAEPMADSGKTTGSIAPQPAVPPPADYGLGGGSDAKIAPPMINYKYVYKGEKFDIGQSQMQVYRRIKTEISGVDAAALLKNMNFGIVDMSTFGSLKLQSLNLVEDKDYGYMFYIDLQQGTIGISQNWLKWPAPETMCADQNCLDSSRLKIADIPDDRTLIAVTDQFLKDHKISTENYGQPFVEKSWKEFYDQAANKDSSLIPTVVTVIYPLRVDGHEIYDEGGNKTGLAVSVDIRTRKASGFGELYALNYDSSPYDVEADASKLIGLAEKGGTNGMYYPYEKPTRTLQVELGTPRLEYIKTYQYSQGNGQSQELLVPAMIFPVTKAPAGQYFYQKNVVVPLPKDLLNKDSGPVHILPAQ